MEPDRTPIAGPTTVGPGPVERAVVWGGFPLLGTGAGWLLKAGADWAAGLPWVPFQGPLRLLASVPEPLATLVVLTLGLIAGLAVAFLAEREYVTAEVTDRQVLVRRGSWSRLVARESIAGVFVDGKQLVLLGHGTEEIVRRAGDLDADRLAAAFLAHGYPWLPDGDPHRDEYRRWVDGTPDLPPGADAILRARATALDKGDDDDTAELRDELTRLGIAVRDDRKRQYWRRTS
jgi:hypothetical protein